MNLSVMKPESAGRNGSLMAETMLSIPEIARQRSTTKVCRVRRVGFRRKNPTMTIFTQPMALQQS